MKQKTHNRQSHLNKYTLCCVNGFLFGGTEHTITVQESLYHTQNVFTKQSLKYKSFLYTVKFH